ncbi:MAG: nucleotide exchange factor GrpE [Verrucomicrobia bacterium TMED44]|nr:MAG: nucleotide exchange factor GrpE [Verrucomicrobia bacterium TMED44]|tara:strand:+ start:35 stop:640 length:606 start_codon:yes stop_codon:yes gene_type:complete
MDQKSDKSKDPIENNEADMQMSSIQNESQKEESDNSETVKKDENLSQKVKDAYSKSEDFQDKYIRVMADIDNLKRRQIKEREDTVIRTRSQIISDLLPVLDAFQMGMNEVEKEESTKNIFVGISMAYKQMESVLNEYGLEIVDPKGTNFDPKYHEALSYQSDEEVEEGYVLQTVRVGYKMRDKLLRPASVIISQGKDKEDN